MENKNKLKYLVRALRLPFISASIFPFVFGSLISRSNFNYLSFLLGIFAVASLHLSANLINDYADAKSGADWQDKNFYQFFGGSKLIQEGIFSLSFYYYLAIFFAVFSAFCVIWLGFILQNFLVFILFLIIASMSWFYSEGPLRFSYHRMGEVIIFLLFGPALVMGGYFIQTGIFPDLKSFLLSLPFGFLTAAILLANEIPDYLDDKKSAKFTCIDFVGQKKAFLIYYSLVMGSFFSILLAVYLGYLKLYALLTLFFFLPFIKAGIILKECPGSKMRLVESSKITVIVQAMVSIGLIASILI